jgi:periplasmic divalent cation tolerance protein
VTGISEVTITAPDEQWLTTFVTDLVREHLCAAAHVDTMRSTYWWSGEMRTHDEARAILHTRTTLVPLIVAATRTAHPYEVPCVAATVISHGNPAYMSWIVAETRDP